MTVYFDTSALVKVLVQEAGSDRARLLWDQTSSPVASRLAYPEARAALASAVRGGRLTPSHGRMAKGTLGRLWSQVHVIELTQAVAEAAGDLAERFALRGYDAVHLASALALGDPSAVVATWDRDLADAAVSAGLSIAPPGARP